MTSKRRCPQRYGFSLRRKSVFPVRHQPGSRLLTQADFDRMYPVFGSKIRYTIYVFGLLINEFKAARRRKQQTAKFDS